MIEKNRQKSIDKYNNDITRIYMMQNNQGGGNSGQMNNNLQQM